jgi:hypothetical protein
MRTRSVGGSGEPVVVRGSIELIGFDYPITYGDDVAREIGDKHDLAVHQVVVCNVNFKVRAGEDCDIPTGNIKVCGDSIFVA